MPTYFGTTPKNDWNPNGPAKSGHNFIQRISDKDAEIAAKNKQYQDYQANVTGARTDYNQAIQNQQNYGDLWNQAKQSEDVEATKAQYQKSANAVNATRTAMTNLPSTINAGSNVVLNASQRNAALGNQMNKYANTLGYWTNQNATDQNMYQTALGVAQNLAGQQMSDQQARVAQQLQRYQAEQAQANELYNQMTDQQRMALSIYDQMLQDEAQHWKEAYDPWAANLSAETSRYTANLAKQASEYEKYLMKKREEEEKSSNNLARQNDIDKINQVYSKYQSTLADLDRETGDFGSYLLGKNSLLGSSLGFNSTAKQAKNLRNKGFEDYLYNESPYLQKILRENYSDLLGTYGIK